MREISIPIVRPMRPEDPERIAAAERAQGWAGAASDKYFTRLRDAAEPPCATPPQRCRTAPPDAPTPPKGRRARASCGAAARPDAAATS